MEWFYATDGQRHGPVSETEFAGLVAAGTIGSSTLVWREGMSNWRAWSEVSGTVTLPAAGAPSAAPASGAADDGTEVCAVSGKRYPRSEMFQFQGKWVSAEHREEFFRQVEGPAAAAPRFVYGGFWWRVLAKILDIVVLQVVNYIAIAALLAAIPGWTRFLKQPQMVPGSVDMAAFFSFLFGTMLLGHVIGISYTVFFLLKYEATPGKLAVGLKIVKSDGSRITLGRILGRYFAEILSGMIIGIGYLMVAFDPEQKRALHDRICDTRVIKARPTS